MKKIYSFLFIICISIFAFAQQKNPELTKIGTYKCGRQPKQVLFSPDNKYILLPLLDEKGFDVFDIQTKKIIKRINPPNSEMLGFAEGLFIPSKKSFFVSQMTTANIYEYSYPDFNFVRTISTDGTWSKFMVWSEEKSIIAVSNWVSNDISIIDYKTGTVVRKIKTKAAPRGLWFLNHGNQIISLAFDGGVIEKFNVDDGNLLDAIKIEKSAMRHVVVNNNETKAYISDMYHRTIYEIDLQNFKISRQIRVYNNPNTIDLLNDKYLFVSCRGPNNPEDYTKRSLTNGQIYIIDVTTMQTVKQIEGGNQPTGLDVSSDGRLLCFSNFQDENIELYNIE